MTIGRLAVLTLVLACATIFCPGARASLPGVYDAAAMREAFSDAEKVDLAASSVSSVVKLREVVGLAPPSEPVFVKTFRRGALPPALEPVFANPHIAGVTINGRYIAIIHTDLVKEHQDVLRHELVHAYITLAAPKPLPFWFQEGSAVHFSMDKARKFYGQPSADQPGKMVGKVVELDETYKQKLQSFHFLIDKVGTTRFYEWYKEAVETGDVDARPLLGVVDSPAGDAPKRVKLPLWLGLAAVAVVVIAAVVGYAFVRRSEEDL